MKAEANKYVSIIYTLKDDDGNTIDSNVGQELLGYIQGTQSLIPGLEAQIEGHEAGYKFSCVIEPKDGYGEVDPRLIVEVPKANFEEGAPIEIGMQFQAMSASGPTIVTVKEVKDDTVIVDGNHELAGVRLHFDVEIAEVRDATEEELRPSGCGSCGGSCGDGGCGGCGSGEGGCEGGCGGCN